ncbi:hypothetical protein KSF_108720 [Reticulibacter mediterranei]|uniref:Uncharacterized protein n=1 Tax=Reticulibacter mediterranei TaxID=2778369 RepID=A0A8J3N748_9CHLR|nr:hypothetical protein KSF_108720 [Reticulibacter mediterranei]
MCGCWHVQLSEALFYKDSCKYGKCYQQCEDETEGDCCTLLYDNKGENARKKRNEYNSFTWLFHESNLSGEASWNRDEKKSSVY